jgi:VanZ family protein
MGNLVKRPEFWASAVLLWAALLWWLSSRVLPPVGPTFNQADKIKHLLYFTAGSYCAARFLLLRRPDWKASMITLSIITFALLVGISDELHQSFTPGRSGQDLGDILADTAGGWLGAVLALRSRPNRSPSPPY